MDDTRGPTRLMTHRLWSLHTLYQRPKTGDLLLSPPRPSGSFSYSNPSEPKTKIETHRSLSLNGRDAKAKKRKSKQKRIQSLFSIWVDCTSFICEAKSRKSNCYRSKGICLSPPFDFPGVVTKGLVSCWRGITLSSAEVLSTSSRS